MADVYPELVALLADTQSPVILDIGAHYGQDTHKLRSLFPAATIYMFEPDPRNIYVIKNNLKILRAELIEAAVGDHDGEAVFHLSSGTHPDPVKGKVRGPIRPWSQSSSLKTPKDHIELVPWVKFEQTTNVKVIKLDTFFAHRKLERVDLIWADVQGAEDMMIAGGQTALARTRFLYTEFAEREVYQGQIGLKQIVERLPGSWDIRGIFRSDALLGNRGFTPR